MVHSCDVRRWSTFVTLTVSLAVAASCVSGDSSDRSDDDSAPEGSAEAGESSSYVYVDTISPVEYEVFEQVVESESPRKVIYRLLTVQQGSWEAWNRTLRMALDSLVNADPSLVAARATLYQVVPLEDMRGKLVPRAWGEWIPNEGWDGARPGARGDVHRSYIYHQHPGWVSDKDER